MSSPGGGRVVTVERLHDGRIERWDAEVIAIDYPHDLAILKCIGPGWLPALTLGKCPLPGADLWMCGYPLGVETPRLSPGIASGYEVLPQRAG
jgi:hypothetical protein